MRKVRFMELMKEPFKRPTPMEMIAAELADAHLEKLNAETAVEYAQSIVNYNTTRIERLNTRLEEYK